MTKEKLVRMNTSVNPQVKQQANALAKMNGLSESSWLRMIVMQQLTKHKSELKNSGF